MYMNMFVKKTLRCDRWSRTLISIECTEVAHVFCKNLFTSYWLHTKWLCNMVTFQIIILYFIILYVSFTPAGTLYPENTHSSGSTRPTPTDIGFIRNISLTTAFVYTACSNILSVTGVLLFGSRACTSLNIFSCTSGFDDKWYSPKQQEYVA